MRHKQNIQSKKIPKNKSIINKSIKKNIDYLKDKISIALGQISEEEIFYFLAILYSCGYKPNEIEKKFEISESMQNNIIEKITNKNIDCNLFSERIYNLTEVFAIYSVIEKSSNKGVFYAIKEIFPNILSAKNNQNVNDNNNIIEKIKITDVEFE